MKMFDGDELSWKRLQARSAAEYFKLLMSLYFQMFFFYASVIHQPGELLWTVYTLTASQWKKTAGVWWIIVVFVRSRVA